jgi:hypothetical protein
MVWQIRNDDASKPSHGADIALMEQLGNIAPVTVLVTVAPVTVLPLPYPPVCRSIRRPAIFRRDYGPRST